MDEDVNLLGKYEEKVAERPWVAITVVVAITLFMGYFASNVSMNTTEESFRPDSTVARAQSKVNEEYGMEGDQVSVIFVAENNVLSREIFLRQLTLEEEFLSSEYSKHITETQRNPTGISSPAKLIARGGFLNEAFRSIISENPQMDKENVFRSLSSSMFNLSPEDMQTILEGGKLDLNLPEISVNTELGFQPYKPEMISSYLGNSPYENTLAFLLSEDYESMSQTAGKSLLTIAIEENLTQEKALEVQRNFRDMADNLEEPGIGFDVRTVGGAILNEKVNEASGKNIGFLMPIAFVVVIVVLFFVYWSFSDTFLNLIALVMAIVWVYGIGYLLDFTFSPNITAVPLLMIGLGIDYGVHYTLRYREEISIKQKIGRAAKRSGATVGLAILLTTVTTMVGFMSGVISEISAVRQFGVLSSLGIASSFVIMLTFFPATKVLLDKKRKKKGKDLTEARGYGLNIFGTNDTRVEELREQPDGDCSNCSFKSLKIGAISASKPLAILVIVGLITGAAAYGASELDAEYNFQDFLPEDLEITESFNMLTEDFSFSQEKVYFYVEGDVASPQVFTSMGEVRLRALDSKFALDSESSESPLQLALSLSNPASPRFNSQFAEIWSERIDTNSDGKIDSDISKTDVLTVYDALYQQEPNEAKRVLKRTSDGYSGMVIRIPVNSQRGESGELVKEMRSASDPVEGLGLEHVVVTGEPVVSHQTFRSINQGQVNSVLITFLVSLSILTGLYFYMRRSRMLGLVAITPLFFVIIWILGSMYFLGIPLNPVTVTIAAIMIGLGVDYSIHLTQRFLEDSKRIDIPKCALCASVGHTGSALFGSALTTVSGFGILSFAIIPPLAQFGQVSALGIFFAFLASVLVLPTFLLIWVKRVK